MKENTRVWKKIYGKGSTLVYEGFMAGGEPRGSGTMYYPDGMIYREGVFGKKGLLCGTEYYPNGNKRFSGLYKYNGGYGPNYPIYGEFYFDDGTLRYEGKIEVYRSGLGWPFIVLPEDYGPVVLHDAPQMPDCKSESDKKKDMTYEDYVSEVKHLFEKNNLSKEVIEEYFAENETIKLLNDNFEAYSKCGAGEYSPEATAYCLCMLY